MAKNTILYITSSETQSNYLMTLLGEYAVKYCNIYFFDRKDKVTVLDDVQIRFTSIRSCSLHKIEHETQYIIIDKDITDYKYYKEKLHDIRARIMKEPKEITENEMWKLLKGNKNGK